MRSEESCFARATIPNGCIEVAHRQDGSMTLALADAVFQSSKGIRSEVSVVVCLLRKTNRGHRQFPASDLEAERRVSRAIWVESQNRRRDRVVHHKGHACVSVASGLEDEIVARPEGPGPRAARFR